MSDTSLLGKRGREGGLGDLVKGILQEDQNRKATKVKKSVKFNESQNVQHIIPIVEPKDEPVEDGPIKEHLVGLAHERRTQKGRDASVLESFEGGDDIEEDQELEQLDGYALEAFNMRDEREHGFIDEDGSFVERKDKDEEELRKDAWLSSVEVVSDEVKAKIQQREARSAASDVPISDVEVARAKKSMSEAMEPRETVMQALQRISARPKGHQSKPKVGRQELTPEERQRRERIERFTEAASTIMASGETDIYEQRREELEHASSLVLPSAGDGVNGVAEAGVNGVADGGEDMFADSDDDQPAGPPDRQAAAASGPPPSQEVFSTATDEPMSSQTEEAAQQAPALDAEPKATGAADAAAAHAVDYSVWPVSELKRVLTEAKVDLGGITDKADLISKMHDLDAARAETLVPPGFVLDPSSGYYVRAEWGLYYDAQSGCYFKDGRWMRYDSATAQYVDL